ncbi:MAG TPA: SRPBCC family protein [Blastocatellia bacterium]|nr:SRPBCC family protein [Blastocatellia bacterium]
MDNGKTMQVAAAAAGAALAYFGFRKGGVVGNAVGIVGTSIAASGIATAAGMTSHLSSSRDVRESIEVMASPEEAYRVWSRLEDFPRFMQNVVEVRKRADGIYHWVVEGPLGQRIEWDAEITADEPGRLIAWRSTTADVGNRGEVHFEPTSHGTRVYLVMRFDQPAGPIGKAVAKMTGSDPASIARADLRRFKQLIEAGEIARVVQLYEPEKARLTETIKEVVQ